MPQLFKSAKPVRLATLRGFVAQLTPGTPVLIPDDCVNEALALGCVPVNEPLPAERDDVDAEERSSELRHAIAALIAKNNPKDFNTDGSPRAVVVRKLVSFPTTGDEVRAAYEALSLGM